MSKILEGLKYSKDHEWVRIEGTTAVVGITDYAQDSLGEVVFVELPAVGSSFEAGESACDIESVKAASEVLCPVSGTVCAVNETLSDSPELLNDDCYGTFIFKLEDITEPDDLMDAAQYGSYLETLK